jgi:hypothetical protein
MAAWRCFNKGFVAKSGHGQFKTLVLTATDQLGIRPVAGLPGKKDDRQRACEEQRKGAADG